MTPRAAGKAELAAVLRHRHRAVTRTETEGPRRAVRSSPRPAQRRPGGKSPTDSPGVDCQARLPWTYESDERSVRLRPVVDLAMSGDLYVFQT